MPKYNEAPIVNIWMNPTIPETYKFILDFKKYYQKFWFTSTELLPTMRFKSLDIENIKESSVSKSVIDFATKNCYSYGEYCIKQNEGKIYRPKELIEEGVRQMCLWGQEVRNFNDDINQPMAEIWFKYIELWYSECLSFDKTIDALSIYRKDFSAKICSRMITEQ